jgi:DNA-binding transcriptional regulator YiaG
MHAEECAIHAAMMFRPTPMNPTHVLVRAHLALGGSQAAFGERFGASRRTVSRWTAGETCPTFETLTAMVAAVHTKDPGLAAELAVGMGSTLVELGIVAPPAPPPPPAPLPVPPVGITHPALVLEGIVHAAADAMDLSPRLVRAGLAAAFRRAGELGVTVGDVDAWLTPRSAPESPAPRRSRTTPS